MLFPFRIAGSDCGNPILLHHECIHLDCCAALANEMYSASAVDNATVAWHFELHDTGVPAIVNTYPEVNLHVSLHAT